ncbi:LapA family protein [Leisingera sp. M527]|uniref:LapA family protein n=1 Tax=unclassified Leisingera TaxID=2614906 RepID=UPI001010A8FF|nr:MULTISPECIES: LapA family protein [unclassified Leisingera]MBQ4823820.1 LapA family protein [Leisingera sp. HS039]MCF6430903.1 LapA family protein [Leisingera sp. MMG026]QAX30721.1 LapA family protein [Leisingera sp. NJS204]QBR35284.1 LapA family protein [Leisingera sp. NJS201]UWQ29387.1 LapA family protein [Leisingera sp. M523]
MRYIRYAVLGSLAIVLVSVALANRSFVELKLMPSALGELFGFNFTIALPLFAVVLGGVGAGLVIGFLWEWLREHKHRSEAAQKTREARRLNREVSKLKKQKNEGKDEVLALLEDAG